MLLTYQFIIAFSSFRHFNVEDVVSLVTNTWCPIVGYNQFFEEAGQDRYSLFSVTLHEILVVMLCAGSVAFAFTFCHFC